MTAAPLTCDANGLVRGFAYHDGWLDGVSTSEREVQLSIPSMRGEARLITLFDVTALHVDGFRQGNIIANLISLDVPAACSVERIEQQIEHQLLLDPAKLAPELRVFILEGSYGANVIAVYRHAEVSDSAI